MSNFRTRLQSLKLVRIPVDGLRSFLEEIEEAMFFSAADETIAEMVSAAEEAVADARERQDRFRKAPLPQEVARAYLNAYRTLERAEAVAKKAGVPVRGLQVWHLSGIEDAAQKYVDQAEASRRHQSPAKAVWVKAGLSS